MSGIVEIVANVGLVLFYLWLLFGPALLIGSSSFVAGRRKVLWVAGALTPLVLSVLGAIFAIVFFPQYPFHLHSNHFPAAFLGALLGAWGVYALFKRRFVPYVAPSSALSDGRAQDQRGPSQREH